MEFIHNKFAGSIGGDANGVPAQQGRTKQGKGARASEAQGSTGVMVQLPAGRQGGSVSRDIGARNVNHRQSDEGIDMKSKSGLSEVQRLEAAMKDMLQSFKAKVEDEAEEHETVELEVAPSLEHPLDDSERAQYDPRFTEALPDVPRTHKVVKGFVHDPHHYILDYKHKEDAEVLALNGQSWSSACSPKQKPDSTVVPEPANYYSPFPGQSWKSHTQTDLHLRQTTNIATISFSLPLVTLTHEEFVNKYAPHVNHPERDGTVKIVVPKRFLLEKFKDELIAAKVNVAKSPYHWNIFDILVTEETSNFLGDFDKIFTSVSAENEQMLNSWSTPRGIDNTAQNLVEGPDQPPEEGTRYFNKILADGASNIRRNDKESSDPVYIAPSFKNGAEHPRWINRNWKDIEQSLARCANGNAYQIALPEKSYAQQFDFLQWFVLSNMKTIWNLTNEYGDVPQVKGEAASYAFGQKYTSGKQRFTLVSKRVLNELLAEKKNKYNQEKQLLKLDDLTNIVFSNVNCNLDSWRGGGVLSTLSYTVVAVSVEQD